ncbi:MAG: succinate dehydrogenase, cytochrome b556 subunit [Alteraurantiacibacter sp. bin_em_oilr2.035]|nr:succinate dehydrogenase, cytochrome b556 subunit [Aurantiacibacter atlanticus]MDF1834407.1 succinate dehydrogenase, cytochrome b556 subunit [Alteraurantiacibacter sp. bin_em_oilr2.035]
MAQNKPQRPLSPHMSIWKWEIHAITSIFHRITGDGMALLGLPMLVWWLYAVSAGPEAYETFHGFASSWVGMIVLIGLTYAFFQHLGSGLRHFVMDVGAGYQVDTARTTAFSVFVFAIIATAAFWLFLFR